MLSSLSVVVPVYNEERSLRRIVRATLEVLPEVASGYELIIVDDGSTDSTGAVADELAAGDGHVRAIHHARNRKMGAALATGYEAARGEHVVPLTGAGHISADELKRLVPLALETDIVVGTWESLPGDADRAVLHKGRVALAVLLFGRHITSAPIYVFRRQLLEGVNLRSATGFLNIELVMKLQRRGCRVRTVPVTWLPRQASRSKSTNVRMILAMALDMLRVRVGL